MGTGLIFAAVIAIWVAYGVPLALRRYDEASRAGSVSSFSGALRILVHRSEPPETETAQVTTPAAAPVTRESARIAARRRRRTLLTLLAALVVVGGLGDYGTLPLWSIAVPVVLVAAWLVACRVQVRAELRIGGAADVTDASDEEMTVVISGQVEDHAPNRKHVMEEVPLRAEDLLEPEIAAAPTMSMTGATLWDPIPVTLPTYVNKPRAARTIRTIEFGEPGAWTSGHVDGEDTSRPDRAESDEAPRRAVGD